VLVYNKIDVLFILNSLQQGSDYSPKSISMDVQFLIEYGFLASDIMKRDSL